MRTSRPFSESSKKVDGDLRGGVDSTIKKSYERVHVEFTILL